MSINIGPPATDDLRPKITVIGVGGAGGNAISNMIAANIEGVEFIVANTDAQALNTASAETRIQLGPEITGGLGAGARPEVGKAAAEETVEEIEAALEGVNMCFIAAGMGGGTGTGAASVIAEAARRKGVLTVGVVTKPFLFEGTRRMRAAEAGIEELQKNVDTLIVIPNQNLFLVAKAETTFKEAFLLADEVLQQGVRSITDLMVMPGLINLDFADVKSVMEEMGKAMMGTGEGDGDNRALEAAERAIANPLLDGVSMQGAKGVIISIIGGEDMKLLEVDEAANHIRELVDEDANIIWGSAFNKELDGKIRVSVVATGIETDVQSMSGSPRSSAHSFSSGRAPKPPVLDVPKQSGANAGSDSGSANAADSGAAAASQLAGLAGGGAMDAAPSSGGADDFGANTGASSGANTGTSSGGKGKTGIFGLGSKAKGGSDGVEPAGGGGVQDKNLGTDLGSSDTAAPDGQDDSPLELSDLASESAETTGGSSGSSASSGASSGSGAGSGSSAGSGSGAYGKQSADDDALVLGEEDAADAQGADGAAGTGGAAGTAGSGGSGGTTGFGTASDSGASTGGTDAGEEAAKPGFAANLKFGRSGVADDKAPGDQSDDKSDTSGAGKSDTAGKPASGRGKTAGESTLFERMANLSRGGSSDDDDDDDNDGPALNIPRFLGRQNNQ